MLILPVVPIVCIADVSLFPLEIFLIREANAKRLHCFNCDTFLMTWRDLETFYSCMSLIFEIVYQFEILYFSITQNE